MKIVSRTLVALCLTLSACAQTTNQAGEASSTLVDSQAILGRYGFVLCDGFGQAGDISQERGAEIIQAGIDAGIGSGGSHGGDGTVAEMTLFVLDDQSLSAFAEIATPAEACVGGEDPNDYVAMGPQILSGPGWRWVGAGTPMLGPLTKSVITSQAEYDLLWAILGEGPETEQIAVDFETEVILTLDSGSGVNFGRCGARIDGVSSTSEGVVVNWFRPGGSYFCDLALTRGTYAIALEQELFGAPPLTVALRRGPREKPDEFQLVEADGFIAGATNSPYTESPPPPTDSPTTLAPAIPDTAPPAEDSLPAGLVSVPQFVSRLGGLDSGFDGPLPPKWEQSGSKVAANIVGRGGYSVAAYPINSAEWEIAVSPPAGFFIDAGPAAVSLPVYKPEASGYVTTSQVINATEYRYSSEDSIVEHVVRWFELRDQVFVVKVDYPNFDKMGVEPNAADDQINLALTGFSPQEIMDDVRFFG